ncbi:hypothetical protein TWF694_004293 [Orbilia ellipsospora]|uniref:Apple domain-containing protein n=1 Tax=Orbilia ellipsospora TaxID=2528407 RepID=A0AAV9WYX1_9PEZI
MRFDLLTLLATPAITGLIEGAAASAYLTCKPAAKSCATLQYEAAPCSTLFAKSKIARPKCTVTPAAVTITQKVTPTVTSTIVVTATNVVTVTTTPPGITITETEQTTEYATSTVTETDDITTIETDLATSTSTLGIPGATCSRVNNKRQAKFEEIGKRANIPSCCSCFLTQTTTAGRPTKIVTQTQAKVTIKKTSTKVITKTVTVDGTPNTSTAHTTITIASVISATTTVTKTATATETDTSVVSILPPSLCGDPFTFNGRNAFTYLGVVASNDGDGITTVSDCCTKCYLTTNCANYVFDNSANTCTIYLVTATAPTDGCVNDACPYGHVQGTFIIQPTNLLYGPGPCGGGITRVN